MITRGISRWGFLKDLLLVLSGALDLRGAQTNAVCGSHVSRTALVWLVNAFPLGNQEPAFREDNYSCLSSSPQHIPHVPRGQPGHADPWFFFFYQVINTLSFLRKEARLTGVAVHSRNSRPQEAEAAG